MSSNKYIISLTTIPSRINYIETTIKSLVEQTLKPEKIILNIPKKYNFRFESSIDDITVKQILNKYIDDVIINYIDEDYGPGTKLLGVIKSSIISLDLKDTYIVLVDDDHIYKPFMLECFNNYNAEHHNNKLKVASFYCYMSHGVIIGQGADSIFIRLEMLNKFEDYYNRIKNYEYINYHDDYYISYFFHLKQSPIEQIRLSDGSDIYNKQISSDIDALLSIRNQNNRINLNKKVNEILSELNNEGKFDDIKNNLVIGCYNYSDPKLSTDKGGIEIFIKTLRKYNQCCHVIILMDRSTYEIKKLMDDNNATVLLRYKGNLMYSRFIHYYDILLNANYDKILMCDINDIIFQSDPFSIQLESSGLYLAEEINSFDDLKNTSTRLNVCWVNKVGKYEKIDSENYRGKKVVCAGTILGNYKSITDYLRWYKEIQEKSNLTLNDQGLLNVYKNDISKTSSTNTYDSCILTLDNFDEFKDQDLFVYISNGDKFINSKGKCYHIVHQLHNLNPELFEYIRLSNISNNFIDRTNNNFQKKYEFNINFIEGVKYDNWGKNEQFQSTLKMLETFENSNYKYGIICQDDFFPIDNFLQELNKTMELLPDTWECLHLCPGFLWGRKFRDKSKIGQYYPEYNMEKTTFNYHKSGRFFIDCNPKEYYNHNLWLGGPVAFIIKHTCITQFIHKYKQNFDHDDRTLVNILNNNTFICRNPQLGYEEECGGPSINNNGK